MSEKYSQEVEDFLQKKRSVISHQTGFLVNLGMHKNEIVGYKEYRHPYRRERGKEMEDPDKMNLQEFFDRLEDIFCSPYDRDRLTGERIIDRPLFEDSYYGKFSPSQSNKLNYEVNKLGWVVSQLLLVPAMKMACSDGEITYYKKEIIRKNFTTKWGFNMVYIDSYINSLKKDIENIKYPEYKETLSNAATQFTASIKETKINLNLNPIDFDKISSQIISLLEEIQNAEPFNKVSDKEKEEIENFKAVMLG